ncbi:hypothetical protein M407DRAFT_26767 [Tulasnella calospora MUT 4182]|uniref:G-protein coupled receptors family 1 profile domain-containing protein n=1 Tax=Tulasnella calospora MUT 4182 TaxID=1051891 RepID=A0A0C3KR42_9AGAM|nr:hypothetical protein M407DRAFT_26767 [Tulasnella calospora MUT 4182]
MSSSSDHTKQLTFGGRVSLLIIVEAALLSQVAVGTLLFYVLFNAIRNHLRPPTLRGRQPWRFIRTATDYYFFNLLFMDLVQALGSVLHIRWIGQGHVDPGAYCRAQGFFKQFGDVGVALTTLVIAAHTFAVLFLRWKVPDTKWLPLGVIGMIWLFLILCTAIPSATLKNFYYPTTYWCWINPEYDNLQYGLEYYILWIVAISGFILYVPLFWRLYSTGKSYPEHRRQQVHIARQLLAYPVAYVVVITPMSVVRKLQFTPSQSHLVTPSLVGFAGVFFALSGFINALLYVITRPSVLGSMLSTFRSNSGGNSTAGAARGNSGAGGQRRGGPPAQTMPEVTVLEGSEVNSGSFPDLADVESGVRGGGRHQGMEMQQANRRRYGDDDDDDGLPTVTVMSENYLAPPSLPVRGGMRTGGGAGLAAPGHHRRDSSLSSGATGKYDEPYSPSREGSNWSHGEK